MPGPCIIRIGRGGDLLTRRRCRDFYRCPEQTRRRANLVEVRRFWNFPAVLVAASVGEEGQERHCSSEKSSDGRNVLCCRCWS